MEKLCIIEQATIDNMGHAHCMLDTWGYKYTFRLCYICCFSTAVMIARMRLVVCIMPVLFEFKDFLSGILRLLFVFKSVTRDILGKDSTCINFTGIIHVFYCKTWLFVYHPWGFKGLNLPNAHILMVLKNMFNIIKKN